MDIVSYLYYKGLIFTGLKRYPEAIEQFRLVLSFPSQVTHKVHTESYKKLVLLTLIRVGEGKIPVANVNSSIRNVFPKDINPVLKQRLEIGFPSYSLLVDAFVNREKPLIFEELLLLKSEEFEKDKNMGLVKKLAKVFRQPLRIKLVELSDTYLTLKNNEIDTSSYIKDANPPLPSLEKTLFDMITSGQVKAKLDQR